MTQEDFEEMIRQVLDSGNWIQAIKVYREKTGVGLAEAKEAVESLAAGGEVAGNSSTSQVPVDDPELIDEMKELIGQGNPLLAVKLFRERTGCGLKESKGIVDQIGIDSGLSSPSDSGCLGTVLLAVAVPLTAVWAILA